MTKGDSAGASVLQQVFHASDFSPASEIAFAHALKAAVIAKADLTILHVSAHPEVDWMEFPGIRATLERWGLLPKNSSRAEVAKLGIGIKKIHAQHDDPVESVTGYLSSHDTDLLVLATDQTKGKVHWLSKSVAGPIARKSELMTLFIPKGTEGFVSIKDGSISLTSILVPITLTPAGQPAIQAAARLARRLECPSGVFTLLHVGTTASMPSDLHLPDLPGWHWNTAIRTGDVVDVIAETALSTKAGLMVLTTEGRNGFLDALRGSHSERILQRASCPLLVIPASGSLPL